jgi:hypothetical protein
MTVNFCTPCTANHRDASTTRTRSMAGLSAAREAMWRGTHQRATSSRKCLCRVCYSVCYIIIVCYIIMVRARMPAPVQLGRTVARSRPDDGPVNLNTATSTIGCAAHVECLICGRRPGKKCESLHRRWVQPAERLSQADALRQGRAFRMLPKSLRVQLDVAATFQPHQAGMRARVLLAACACHTPLQCLLDLTLCWRLVARHCQMLPMRAPSTLPLLASLPSAAAILVSGSCQPCHGHRQRCPPLSSPHLTGHWQPKRQRR